MKRTLTYSLLTLGVILVLFGFSSTKNEGKVHVKVTKEENGGKTVFEKIYTDMKALKADSELKAFDIMVSDWVDNHSKDVIIKKRIDSDKAFTGIDEDAGDDEIIEVNEKKIIKVKTDGEDKVFTITSEGEGDHHMVWVDEDGNKTELTEESIKKMAEDGEEIEIHKKIKIITSDENDKGENVFIMKSDGGEEMVWIDEDGNKTKLTKEKIAELKEKHEESGNVTKDVEVIVTGDEDEKKNIVIMKKNADDVAEIEVEIEKEVGEDGHEVISEKKIWITKDGKKVELDNENTFEFQTDGEHMTIVVDDKTVDIDELSDGEFGGENVMIFKTKGDGDEGVKQTMDINIEEKDGEKYIEIDIKRNAPLNVSISEIQKRDVSLQDAKMNFKNNLKPSQMNYYPNPNNGKFNLKFTLDSKDEVTVKVMDILGNEVYKEKLMDFKGVYDNEINLTGKEKGIYIMQILQKKKALTRKILIE